MNYIVLEGLSLYLFFILVVLLLLVTLGSLICVAVIDKRKFALGNMLLIENNKVRQLDKENFVLKLKCGEFDFDEQ